jgi:hypothetical protein
MDGWMNEGSDFVGVRGRSRHCILKRLSAYLSTCKTMITPPLREGKWFFLFPFSFFLFLFLFIFIFAFLLGK